jgi:hypothetical protein
MFDAPPSPSLIGLSARTLTADDLPALRRLRDEVFGSLSHPDLYVREHDEDRFFEHHLGTKGRTTGLFAPAQTPPAIVERLNHELMEVLRADDVRARLAEGGATAGSGSAADFARFVQREQSRYASVVKAANIKE